jgi:hypothetical protein
MMEKIREFLENAVIVIVMTFTTIAIVSIAYNFLIKTD